MITRRLCAIAVSFPDARPFPIRAPHFNSHKGDASNAVKRKKTKKQERSPTHATQKARRPPRMYTRADKERNQRSRDVITVGHYPRFPCIRISSFLFVFFHLYPFAVLANRTKRWSTYCGDANRTQQRKSSPTREPQRRPPTQEETNTESDQEHTKSARV